MGTGPSWAALGWGKREREAAGSEARGHAQQAGRAAQVKRARRNEVVASDSEMDWSRGSSGERALGARQPSVGAGCQETGRSKVEDGRSAGITGPGTSQVSIWARYYWPGYRPGTWWVTGRKWACEVVRRYRVRLYRPAPNQFPLFF
jgi:hypothetical protein